MLSPVLSLMASNLESNVAVHSAQQQLQASLYQLRILESAAGAAATALAEQKDASETVSAEVLDAVQRAQRQALQAERRLQSSGGLVALAQVHSLCMPCIAALFCSDCNAVVVG